MMKMVNKKSGIKSLIVAFALVLLLPPLFNSHVALADDDRQKDGIKFENHKIEGKQVGESNNRTYKNDDDDDDDDDEREYKADNANNAPAPADNNSGNQPSAPTVQPNPSPSFENGQSAFIQVAGQTATLNVTLSVVLGGESEVRVNAEQVLDFMNVPYVKYNKGTLFEMYSDRHHIIVHTGKNIAFVNGQKQSLPAAPIIQNGQFLIPLDVLANQLGYSLTWYADSKTFIMKRGV